jgi:hypothetical protein
VLVWLAVPPPANRSPSEEPPEHAAEKGRTAIQSLDHDQASKRIPASITLALERFGARPAEIHRHEMKVEVA